MQPKTPNLKHHMVVSSFFLTASTPLRELYRSRFCPGLVGGCKMKRKRLMRSFWIGRNDRELLTKRSPKDPRDKAGLWIMLRLFAKFPLMECALLWHCSLAYFLIISLDMVPCCTLFRQEPIPQQWKPLRV